MTRGTLTVISGFSGSGKGTIVRRLLSLRSTYTLSVSMTTRAPREGERDGVDYFFVSREAFETAVRQDGLLEHAEYVGNCYGTPRAWVNEQLDAGRDVLLEIEVQGGAQIRRIDPDAVLMFVTPPSAAELKARLTGRHTEDEDKIRQRLARAAEETQSIPDYDYLIVNDDLDECVRVVDEIIQNSRLRTARTRQFAEQLRRELEELT